MEQKEPVVLLSFTDGTKLSDVTFADIARRRMAKKGQGDTLEVAFPRLTTSKLRNIYGLIMNIYTKINEPDDFERHRPDIQYLKVKMAYEAGRENVVKEFLEKTHLIRALDGVKTYEQFMLYCRYAESLVAFFKFYGGKDN
jgi:CRISPR-associated protein Csm2